MAQINLLESKTERSDPTTLRYHGACTCVSSLDMDMLRIK